MGEVYDYPRVGDQCQVIHGLYEGCRGRIVQVKYIEEEDLTVKVLMFGEPQEKGGHWLWEYEVMAFESKYGRYGD